MVKLSDVSLVDLMMSEKYRYIIVDGKKAKCEICKKKKARRNIPNVGPICNKCWENLTLSKLLFGGHYVN